MRFVPHADRVRSRERGAAIVEAAMLLPIIFTMLLGIVDASRAVTSKMMLAYAVTVGARAATANANTTTNVQNAVIAAAPMLALTSSNIPTGNITTSAASWSARTSGSTVTVKATYAYAPINPLLTKIGSRTWSYTSTISIP